MSNVLRSMTGFGAATAAGKGFSVRAEARSVNHRHLQTKLRLPPEFAHLEPQVDALVHKKLARGAVQLSVKVELGSGELPTRIHTDVARAYLDALSDLASDLNIGEDVGLRELMRLPGVIVTRDEDGANDRAGRLVLQAVTSALRDLVQMREQEGAALAKDLATYSGAIKKTCARIQRRAPSLVKRHQADLKRRVEKLLGGAQSISGADLAREIALLADKLDVSEELSRLEAHMQQLDKLLSRGGAAGRKLDFLVQEFLREANTIGSKCNDAQVAHDVVDLKTHIERLREQVQNVE